jgi:hypothetical protein
MERLTELGLISKVERRRRKDGTLGTWTVTVNFTTAHGCAVDEPDHRSPVSTTTAHPVAVVHRSPIGALEPSCIEPSVEPSSALVDAPNLIEWSFDAFWAGYPNKTGKKRALVAWKNLTNQQRAKAIGAVDAWARYWALSKTEMRFIPHPTTWLHDERWDAPIPEVAKPKRTTGINGLGLTADAIERIRDKHFPTRDELRAAEEANYPKELNP